MQPIKNYCWRVMINLRLFVVLFLLCGTLCNIEGYGNYSGRPVTIPQKIQAYENEGLYLKGLELIQYCRSNLSPLTENRYVNTYLNETTDRLNTKYLQFGFSRTLFNETCQPQPKLLQLLKILSMPFDEQTSPSLEDIKFWTQKNLKRTGERHEQQKHHFESLYPNLMPLLKEIFLVQEICPHLKEYEGALIHGATIKGVRLRLKYLLDQWNQGIRFKTLYFLTGERLLFPHENETALLTNELGLNIRPDWEKPEALPETEKEMIEWIWDQTETPENMKSSIEVFFVNAPMKIDPIKQVSLRPTTSDTVKEWVQMNPTPGTYLAVSNNPYIPRQDLILRKWASPEILIETVGPAACEEDPKSIFLALDEIASTIYEIAEKTKQ